MAHMEMGIDMDFTWGDYGIDTRENGKFTPFHQRIYHIMYGNQREW